MFIFSDAGNYTSQNFAFLIFMYSYQIDDFWAHLLIMLQNFSEFIPVTVSLMSLILTSV